MTNANQLHSGTVSINYGSGFMGNTYRTLHYNPGTVFWLQFVYGNWTNPGETNTPNTITVKASVELGGTPGKGGILQPVYFDRQRSESIKPGSFAISDPLYVNLPAGSSIYLRTAVSVTASGEVFPQGGWRAGQTSSTGESVVPNADTTDTSANVGGGSDGLNYSPVAILGYSLDPSVALVGDSIMEGTGDMDPFVNIGGFAIRAIGNNFGWVRTSQGGETAAAYISESRLRGAIAGWASSAIVEYGTNDIGSGASLRSVQASLLTIWSDLNRSGVAVWQTTILPRANTTDGFRTLANQSLFGSAASESVRTSLNDWLRDGAPIENGVAVTAGTSGAIVARKRNHPLSGYLETADAVESSRNSGKWKVAPHDDYTGELTLGGVQNLTDSTQHFPVTGTYGGLSGSMFYVTGGTGAGQWTPIFSNTATQILLQNSLQTALDATSTYAIYRPYAQDGIHPSPTGHIAMSAAIHTGVFR